MRALEVGDRFLSSALKRPMSVDQMDGLPARGWALGPGTLEEPGRGARGPPTLKLQDSLWNEGPRAWGPGFSATGRRYRWCIS